MEKGFYYCQIIFLDTMCLCGVGQAYFLQGAVIDFERSFSFKSVGLCAWLTSPVILTYSKG